MKLQQTNPKEAYPQKGTSIMFNWMIIWKHIKHSMRLIGENSRHIFKGTTVLYRNFLYLFSFSISRPKIFQLATYQKLFEIRISKLSKGSGLIYWISFFFINIEKPPLTRKARELYTWEHSVQLSYYKTQAENLLFMRKHYT